MTAMRFLDVHITLLIIQTEIYLSQKPDISAADLRKTGRG